LRIRPFLAGAAASVVIAAIIHERAALSADHMDSPATIADPTVDIADHYAWVDGQNVILAMTVDPAATGGTLFSDAAEYVFHTSSGYQVGSTPLDYDVLCTFDMAQTIQCWGGTNEYVTGDASKDSSPLASADGKLKVFAGPRADPFFFNRDGFKATVADIVTLIPMAAGAGVIDDAGCMWLPPDLASGLTSQLAQSTDGGPPVDAFRTSNVLAIVVSLDRSLVNAGGPVMASWVSTHKKQ